MGDFGAVDDAAVGNDRVIQHGAVDFGSRQEPRPGENRGAHVEKVEARQFRSHVEVGLEERADRSDVLPVTLENVGKDSVRLDGAGNDVLAEIGIGVFQQLEQDVAVEHINAHRRQKELLVALNPHPAVPVPLQLQRIQRG